MHLAMINLKFQPGELSYTTTVLAEIHGELGVHPTLGLSKLGSEGFANEWTVTHVRTGFLVHRGLGLLSARWLASRAQDAFNWDFDDPAAIANWSSEDLERMRVLRLEAGDAE